MKTELAERARCRTCDTVLQLGKLEGQCAVCLVKMIFDEGDADAEEFEGGRSFADYELHEEIGRGGMGLVYRAWQPGLRRTVALKLLLGGAFASREAIARFKKEAQIAAGLHHPHLVPIYAADEADGQPYYVMELIAGESLAALTRGTPLPVGKAARYLLATARAVEYAHSQGVLHRDLKPSNILIDEMDQPRVADFGLARMEHETQDLTLTGETVGSPAFMAPELAGGGKNLSSPSTDLYALGAVLYQALTGRPPFQGASILQILDQAKNVLPIPPRQLVPGVPVDLETVCLKCLEKEPSQRYASVAELADDLARYLCGEPVQARPVSGMVQGWRWLRRRPALAGSLLALGLSLVIGTGLVLRKAAENQRQATDIQRLSHEVRGEAYANGVSAAVIAWRQGNYAMARQILVKSPGAGDSEFRDFSARWLSDQLQDRSLAVLAGQRNMVLAAKFSHDGRWLATGTQGAVCQLWDVENRHLSREWSLPGQVFSIDFSPDDRLLYLGTGQEGRATGVSVWDRQSGKKMDEYPGSMASLSADGTRLATVETDFYYYGQMAGPVRVWEVATRRALGEWQGSYRSVALSPNGQQIAMASSDGQVTQVDIATQQQHKPCKMNGIPRGLRFSPDGRWLAAWCYTASNFPDAAILDTQQERPVAWISQPQQLASLVFAPDSSYCMTAGSDYSVHRWSCEGKEDLSGRLLGSQDEVWALDFHPHEAVLATGNKVGDIVLWSTVTTAAAPVKLSHISYERPHFSQDSRFLSTQEAKDRYVTRDRESGEICYRLPAGFFPIHLSAGGREIIGFSAASSRLTWWDAVDGKETKSYPCPGLIDIVHPHLLLRVTPDGQSWLALDAPTRVGLHRSSDGTLIRSWTVPEMHGQIERDGHIAVSQDGALAAWSPTGSNTVWLLRASGEPQPLVGHRMDLTRLEFSPDGQTLASSSVDHTIRLWATASGVCHTVLPGHFEEVSDISFSPDGRCLASVALGDSVKFWQLPLGRELVRLEDPVLGGNLLFSPDGRTLAVTSDCARPHGPDRSLKLLRAP